jgi:hypothetical protein
VNGHFDVRTIFVNVGSLCLRGKSAFRRKSREQILPFHARSDLLNVTQNFPDPRRSLLGKASTVIRG